MDRPIIIVGAGQAGAQAAMSLRDQGHRGPVTVIGDEPHLPYQRPPLSKTFLKENASPDRLYLRPHSFYADRGISLILRQTVVALDARNRTAILAGGRELPYGAAVLALGTRPRLPKLPGAALENIFSLRKIADVEALRAALAGVCRVIIIGGGYVGLEVASALRAMEIDIVLLEAEDRVLKRVTSVPVSSFFTELHRENGVEILNGIRVAGFQGDGRVSSVRLEDGRSIPADAVLMAVGAIANAELAGAAGLVTDDGVMVDEYGRTSAPDVYACGDCTRFPSRRYGRNVRLESVQNAIDQAKCVAAAIAGNGVAYDPVPWFWSDQYSTKLQIAGLSSPDDRVTVAGEPGAGPFAVEYRRYGRLVAVDAIDNARAHMLARRRIAEETALPTPSFGA